MQCVVCSAPQSRGLTDWHTSCTACGYEGAALAVKINAKRDGAAVDELEREVGLKSLRQENFRDILHVVRKHAQPQARRLLDVGCAHGWFLETAKEYFDVMGIEPDAVVGNRTASRGLPVRPGYFPDALAPDESFDVIVFNDVIEHIPDIAAALDACRARLSENGLLVLNLPNSRGFFYRLSTIFARLGWHNPFNRLWQKDLPSPHVHYFNPRNLQLLVARHGFAGVYSGQLPSLRAKGLFERIRCTGDISGLSLYLQYLAVLCSIPVLSAFPSDIMFCVFRKTNPGEALPVMK
ncbi:class I SAM-dependent methyltransferase [Duganella phyllosphaerae]|uniref:Ubiquinone biosynthesis O-methyltransferase n=1 Tax=Duganella phyllosphaerae TaxID=762836 RepID=A0A1E7X4K7_9BURK|nr:class I SAM-dependent methyltransferase [Duganella phyllosphaerae]OFA07378.1 ubiquinone biosynthesis O-methyltransferase [Duganella phyllosphaerae]